MSRLFGLFASLMICVILLFDFQWAVAQSSLGNIIVTSDTNCIVYVDGKESANLNKKSAKSFQVNAGQHTVYAVAINGIDRWGAVPVDVQIGKRSSLMVQLVPVIWNRLRGERKTQKEAKRSSLSFAEQKPKPLKEPGRKNTASTKEWGTLVKSVKSNDMMSLMSQLDKFSSVNILNPNFSTNAEGCYGKAPNNLLMLAADSGGLEVCQYLLENGAQINYAGTRFSADAIGSCDENCTPLMISCVKNDLPLMKLLLKYNANANQKDARGQTPLMKIARGGSRQAVEVLIEKGADMTQQDGEGRTALFHACDNLQAASELISYFVHHGANPDQSDLAGLTPLMWAVSEMQYSAVKAIVENGANVNLRATDGRSALFLAEVRLIETAAAAQMMKQMMGGMFSGGKPQPKQFMITWKATVRQNRSAHRMSELLVHG